MGVPCPRYPTLEACLEGESVRLKYGTVGLDWSWDCGACTMGVHGACGRGPNYEYTAYTPYKAALCRLLAVPRLSLL